MNRDPSRSPFTATFSEDDVRRLAGDQNFRQGDAWQRAGHVHNPALLANGLGADVVGTWRRTDRVTAAASGSRLRTQCSCGAGEFCRHAAALLLHWLRAPTSFASGGIAADDLLVDLDGDEEMAEMENDAPRTEYARLLSRDTMTHLREIARARGVQVIARNKAELIDQLATILSSPESVDAAIAGLDDDARLTLQAIDLANVGGNGSRDAIGTLYRALGGAGKLEIGAPAAANRLVDLALVIPDNRYATPPPSYTVPRVVTTSLAAYMRRAGHPGRLLQAVDDCQVADAGAGAATRGALSLIEIIQVIVHEVLGGAIGTHTPIITPAETAFMPQGWRIDPTNHATDTPPNPRGPRNQPQSARRLAPLPLAITRADLQHLIALTGAPVRLVEFAIESMLGLGIISVVAHSGQRHVEARSESLQTLLSFPPIGRLVVLSDAYVTMGDPIDLRLVVGPDRPLQLYFQPSYYASMAQFQPQDSKVRRFLAHLLGWLAEGEPNSPRWYDLASLLDLLWNMAPSLLGQPVRPYADWWFTAGDQPEPRLDLALREDWQRIMEPLLTAMLAGPFTWLGLVETVRGQGETVAFRALPASRVLAGEHDGSMVVDPSPTAPPLLFDLNPEDGTITITVPAGSPDPAIHTLLSSMAELHEISREGLQYRLTPKRLQPVFEDGLSGPDLITDLTRRGGGTLPGDVRETLERWWDGYGAIRLYDDLTLIELSDDFLLRELRATSSLDRALIHTFSPRLIAVNGAMANELIAELTRLGHTPRVVEGV